MAFAENLIVLRYRFAENLTIYSNLLDLTTCYIIILQKYLVFRKQILWYSITHKDDVCKILVAVALLETCTNCFHANILQLTTRLAADLLQVEFELFEIDFLLSLLYIRIVIFIADASWGNYSIFCINICEDE